MGPQPGNGLVNQFERRNGERDALALAQRRLDRANRQDGFARPGRRLQHHALVPLAEGFAQHVDPQHLVRMKLGAHGYGRLVFSSRLTALSSSGCGVHRLRNRRARVSWARTFMSVWRSS